MDLTEKQWDMRVPTGAQQWYIGTKSSKNLKAMLKDMDAQQWFGIT
jgi:hypothetical protein